jgi:hypothetical protein
MIDYILVRFCMLLVIKILIHLCAVNDSLQNIITSPCKVGCDLLIIYLSTIDGINKKANVESRVYSNKVMALVIMKMI